MSYECVKPLGDRVLVRRSKVQTTKNGILLPESAQEKPKQGEILATGPGKRDEEGNSVPMNVKQGDQILFSSYAGTEYQSDDDNEYLIMSENDILCVIS